MGVLLKWKKITSEATYNLVRVYRASGDSASYDLIHTQEIYDNTYYDPAGIGSYLYQVEFYDSVTGDVSAKSDPIRGGTYYGYCTVDEIRQTTNLKESDVSDTHLATLIEFCGTQLNADMNIKETDELVQYIDAEKGNDQDGVNSTFYTKKYPIADSDNNFRITTADIQAYQIDQDGNRSELTVTQIHTATGQFRLDNAPDSTVKIYIDYSHCQRIIDPPDTLVKMGCILLTASWAYGKINIGKATRFRMGNLTVFRDMDSYKKYYDRYRMILALINDRSIVNIKQAPSMPADIINMASRLTISGN